MSSFFSRLFAADPAPHDAFVPDDAPFVVVADHNDNDNIDNRSNNNDTATAVTEGLSLDHADDLSRSTISEDEEEEEEEDDAAAGADSVALSSLTNSGTWLGGASSSSSSSSSSASSSTLAPAESLSVYPSLENFTSESLVVPASTSTDEDDDTLASSHRSGRPRADDYQQLGSHLFHSSLLGGSVQASRQGSSASQDSTQQLSRIRTLSNETSSQPSSRREDQKEEEEDEDVNDKVLDEILEQEGEELGGLCAVLPPTPPSYLLKSRHSAHGGDDFWTPPPSHSPATCWMVEQGKFAPEFCCGLCRGVVVGAWVWNCCGATTCAACVLERARNPATVGDLLWVADPGSLRCPGCHQTPTPQRRWRNRHGAPTPCWTPCRALDVAILQTVLAILPPPKQQRNDDDDDDDEQEIDCPHSKKRHDEKEKNEKEIAMSLQFQWEYAQRLQAWHDVVQRRRREVLLERLKRREAHVWKQQQRRTALADVGIVLAAALTLGFGMMVGGRR